MEQYTDYEKALLRPMQSAFEALLKQDRRDSRLRKKLKGGHEEATLQDSSSSEPCVIM